MTLPRDPHETKRLYEEPLCDQHLRTNESISRDSRWGTVPGTYQAPIGHLHPNEFHFPGSRFGWANIVWVTHVGKEVVPPGATQPMAVSAKRKASPGD